MFNKKDASKLAPEKVEVKVAADSKPAQNPEVKATLTQAGSKQEAKTGLSQREAAFLAVMHCFEKNNIKFTNGKAADLLNPEMRKQITDSLCADFRTGKISLRDTPNNKEKLGDEKELRVYVTGLLNNWLRRDKRLNGSSAQ